MTPELRLKQKKIEENAFKKLEQTLTEAFQSANKQIEESLQATHNE